MYKSVELARAWCGLRRAIGLALIVAACAAMPTAASAQHRGGARGTIKDTSSHDRPMMLSFFTGFHYRDRFRNADFPFVFAGRFYIPLAHDGFIRPLNDEFGIEFGVDTDVYFGGNRFGLGFPIAAMWDFHFSEMFDAYFKAGFIFGNDFIDRPNNTTVNDFWWGPHAAAGIRLRITDWFYFRAEGGYPTVMAGIAFAF